MHSPFANRRFRRLFVGRVVTNIGDSFYFIAAMWLVYSLTEDPFYTGLAGFVTMLPQAFQFAAGPLVDRWSIRRTLVGTQLVQVGVVSLIPIADVLGVLRVELVLVVMPILASLNQLVYPAQVTALPRILDEEELVAANAAFSVAYQGLDMVANGLGGILIGLFGAVALFALDAITFGVAALLFATISIPSAKADAGGVVPGPEDDDGSLGYLVRLWEGVDVLRGTFFVWLIIGSAVVNITYGMTLAAIPVYADGLGIPSAVQAIGAAGTYGILMGSLAAGNLVGAVATNRFGGYRLGRSMIVGYPLAGSLWIAGLLVDWLPGTALLFTLAFIPNAIIAVQVAAVIQSAPPAAFVGRVSSIFGSASASMIPVGALLGGAIAGWFGPRAAMVALAVGNLSFGLYVLVHPALATLPAPHRVSLDPTDDRGADPPGAESTR